MASNREYSVSDESVRQRAPSRYRTLTLYPNLILTSYPRAPPTLPQQRRESSREILRRRRAGRGRPRRSCESHVWQAYRERTSLIAKSGITRARPSGEEKINGVIHLQHLCPILILSTHVAARGRLLNLLETYIVRVWSVAALFFLRAAAHVTVRRRIVPSSRV